MASNTLRASLRLAPGLVALATAAACTFSTAPTSPRPALAAPALAPKHGAVAVPALESWVELGNGCSRGTLHGGGETVEFELRRTPHAETDDGRSGSEAFGRPLVVVLPILAGGDELLDQVALRLTPHGFDVAWCARAGDALRRGQRSQDLDELFERTVLHQRMLLAWLREREQPPRAVFVLGMSLGGMVATVLAAEEPQLLGVAVCLSGGDVSRLVAVSSEPRVQRWRAWRHEEDGVGDDHLRWELCEFLRHDPLRFAPAVSTEAVLMVDAVFDTVIPRHHQNLLWEALGRPARMRVPFGHYSAALAIDPILTAVARHFDARLAAASVAPEAPIAAR